MAKLFEPTPWHKDEALGHFFFYRVRQLLYASKLATLRLPEDAPLDDRIRYNALVESYLIHSRALYTFLTNGKDPDERHKRDVLLKDYGLDESFVITLGSGYKDRLDQDLAHFTYSENSEVAQKQWDDEKLVYPILRAAKEFVEHMLRKYSFTTEKATLYKERLEWLQKQLDECLEVVG